MKRKIEDIKKERRLKKGKCEWKENAVILKEKENENKEDVNENKKIIFYKRKKVSGRKMWIQKKGEAVKRERRLNKGIYE